MDEVERPASLAAMLADLGIEATAEQVAQLDQYRQLLWSWNEKMNLTRHTTLEKFVARDVLDSWELTKLLARGERVLDVGTGGGVPGLVMAILRPDLSLNVCESTGKKATTVESIVAEMELPISVYACRAENVLELKTFDTLVARAVAPLPKILRWFQPHWDAFDQLLVIKGQRWAEERGEARHAGLLGDIDLRKAATYVSPEIGAESVILKLTKNAAED